MLKKMQRSTYIAATPCCGQPFPGPLYRTRWPAPLPARFQQLGATPALGMIVRKQLKIWPLASNTAALLLNVHFHNSRKGSAKHSCSQA